MRLGRHECGYMGIKCPSPGRLWIRAVASLTGYVSIVGSACLAKLRYVPTVLEIHPATIKGTVRRVF
jgi:hypothetical protein